MVRSLLVGQQEQLLARPAVDFAVQMMVPITVSPPLSLRNHHRGERTRGRSETIDVDFMDTFEDDFGETMQTGCADYPPSWAYHCPAGLFVSYKSIPISIYFAERYSVCRPGSNSGCWEVDFRNIS